MLFEPTMLFAGTGADCARGLVESAAEEYSPECRCFVVGGVVISVRGVRTLLTE